VYFDKSEGEIRMD